MGIRSTILFVCFLIPFLLGAQQKENELISSYKLAGSDAEKVKALGRLVEYYYINKLEKKADSVLQKQLLAAEISQDKELVFSTLFSNGISYIGSWASIETFDRSTKF